MFKEKSERAETFWASPSQGSVRFRLRIDQTPAELPRCNIAAGCVWNIFSV